jgi:hypothetical protein
MRSLNLNRSVSLDFPRSSQREAIQDTYNREQLDSGGLRPFRYFKSLVVGVCVAAKWGTPSTASLGCGAKQIRGSLSRNVSADKDFDMLKPPGI